MAHEMKATPIWQRVLAGLSFLAYVVVTYFAIQQRPEPWWKTLFNVSVSFSLVPFGVMVIGLFISRHRTGGVLLLDCGAHRWRKPLLFATALFLLIGVSIPWMTKNDLWIGPGVSMPLFAALYFVMATSRLQIKEQGLWVYLGLLPWSSVRSWSFRGNSLILDPPHLAQMYYYGFHDGFPVSADLREEAEELLTKLCPKPLPT